MARRESAESTEAVMHPFVKYLLWQVPGWIAVAALLAGVRVTFDVPLGLILAVGGTYVLKDLLLYPAMRIAFRPPPQSRPLGKRAVVVDAVDPVGLVRVDGELWQARAVAGPLPTGSQVVVRDASGLTLLVEASAPAAPFG